MKLYLLTSLAPKAQHIHHLLVSAPSAEEAFAAWGGHYGWSWPALAHELSEVGGQTKVYELNLATRSLGSRPA